MSAALKATRDKWKTTVMSRKSARLPFQRTFTNAEFTKTEKRLAPQSTDDRWFIFFEKDWLYFHRSWMGRCIFQVRFKIQKAGCQILEAWASRNPRNIAV
jgi:hypothetical protein